MRQSRTVHFFALMLIAFAGTLIAGDVAIACGGRHSRQGGGFGIQIGPGFGQGSGYGYGRIGPPTSACAEKMRLEADLQRLYGIRAQVQAGKKFIYSTYSGGDYVLSTHAARKKYREYATGGQLSVDQSVADMAQMQQGMDQAREKSVAIVDERIASTQDRIGQLQYDCPD